MFRAIVVILFTVIVHHASVRAADADRDEISFAYKKFSEAVYAVYRDEKIIDDDAGRELRTDIDYDLYRYRFDKHLEDPVVADRYSKHRLDMDPRRVGGGFSKWGTVGLTAGGGMPIISEIYRLQLPFPGLTHKQIASRPFMLPVFEPDGMTIRLGQSWTYKAPPFPLYGSIVKRFFVNEGKIGGNIGPPTLIELEWTKWEEMNGHQCAVIEFSFEVTPDESLAVGEEDGGFQLCGTSWFSPELGLPIVTTFKANGFHVSKMGVRHNFAYHHKEVLVHVEPIGKQNDSASADEPNDSAQDVQDTSSPHGEAPNPVEPVPEEDHSAHKTPPCGIDMSPNGRAFRQLRQFAGGNKMSMQSGTGRSCMDFDKRLGRAIERGNRTREEKSRAASERELSEEELRNLHSQYRLDISEHIENCLGRLADHFPGFRLHTIVSDEGWGARISRDDIDLQRGRDARTLYSRVELLVSPHSSAHIIELLGKGTIRNKEVFNRRHYQLLAQVDPESFQETIDLWVLEYAELYAARS